MPRAWSAIAFATCLALVLSETGAPAETPEPDDQLSQILLPAQAANPAPSSAAPTPATAAPKPAPDAADSCGFNFSKVPPVRPLARTGNFIIPPTGCHYYTFLDLINGRKRENPRMPFGLYSLNPLSFFDYDFRYLDNPENTQTTWSDGWKRIRIGDNWLDSMGGEFRTRYADERNSRGTGVNNDYYLLHTRVYNDLWYKDEIRAFVEFIYAETMNQNLRPLLVDATGPDLLNAFVDAKIDTPFDSPLYVRIGRQELCFGSQRLVSTLDWANTRRTFQGVRTLWTSDKFNFDAFWTQPVIPDRSQFDSVDDRRNFFGVWTTYKPRPGATFDLYYLGLTTATRDIAGDVQTLGTRATGDIEGQLLYDGEGMVQFGERGDRHIFAKSVTGGLGWRFKNLPGNVHVWAYYDLATGTPNPTDLTSTYETFNQLFPFGHYYLGFLDLVARQNIQDLNFHLNTNPMPWLTTWTQIHIFHLDQPRDALYLANGVPYRIDPTGRAGNYVGTELDLAVNVHVSEHQDVFLGYSKLFAGRFWQSTGPPSNPDLFYAQYSVRW